MLIAWSISEIVRYSYFVFHLRRSRSRSVSRIGSGGGGGGGAAGVGSGGRIGGGSDFTKKKSVKEEEEVPALLTWARYNFFYVLYPLGIGSEMVLIWKASQVKQQSIWWRWGFWGVLVGYIPGEFFFMGGGYTYLAFIL